MRVKHVSVLTGLLVTITSCAYGMIIPGVSGDYYAISNVNDEVVYTFIRNGNPDLTPERSVIYDVGMDFELGHYVSIEVDYYHKQTNNLLYVLYAPGITQYVNDGKLLNQGVDFVVTGHLMDTRSVKLDMSVNGSYNKNAILQMPHDASGNLKDFQENGMYGWSKGHSIYDYCIRK